MKIVISFLLASALSAQTFTATVEGPPHDGDTVAIKVKSGIKPGAYRLRLFGADAPEIAQEGGEDSRRSLARLAPIGVTLTCELREWSYQRPVASCVGGVDISTAQVRAGHALVWTPERAKSKDWSGWRPKAPGRLASQKTVKRAYYIEQLLIQEAHAASTYSGVWEGLKRGVKPCPAWVFRKGGCEAPVMREPGLIYTPAVQPLLYPIPDGFRSSWLRVFEPPPMLWSLNLQTRKVTYRVGDEYRTVDTMPQASVGVVLKKENR